MPEDWEARQRAIDALRLRKRGYQLAFSSQKENAVLKDLAQFCRADESCFHADARLHAVAEGRREVYLRIMQHLNKEPDELYALYTNQKGE